MEEIDGIGATVAIAIENYFKIDKNNQIINNCLKLGVEIDPTHFDQSHMKMLNEKVVITGSFQSLSRGDLKQRLEKNGASVTTSVSSKTTALIVGDNPGSKLKRAQKIIENIYSTTIGNASNPPSMSFYQSDTYRFFFLLSFMHEYFKGSDISQEYAISLVPKKYASRIKRLQVLKHAVQLGYIIEQQSTVDRRRRIYSPSETLLHDFIQYANDSDKAIKMDKAS
mgnify:CR=1 FL=1